ncbi:Adenylylsulfate kinase [Candidatus Saccharibacteria bacterium RAAC3_TM7_1]|nr:Adenylylsulfate kinase [Candidatus Saccharibacteria bacterium RAAC3_TM7_1]
MSRKSDEAYWAEYYQSGAAPEEPSRFAQYVVKKFASPGLGVIELGCGNGRDARFFASRQLAVTAVDLCRPEIEAIQQDEEEARLENPVYEAGDFTRLPEEASPFDIVYSRFTLHSVDADGQARTLDWSYRNLAEGGYLCIETRGQKNELYKKGEPVEGELDAFIYDSHYRRFVDFEEFKKEVDAAGFTILEADEDKGYAPFEDTDYHFIRVIAQK